MEYEIGQSKQCLLNSQDRYNTDNGSVAAIPIVVYHTIVTYPDLNYSNRPVDTTVNLFEQEMRYLYNNGFKVLLMSDLVTRVKYVWVPAMKLMLKE